MASMVESIKAYKKPVILIAGGKDIEEVEYEPFQQDLIDNVRVLVLVGGKQGTNE